MVIFTDALSVLSTLRNPRQKDLNELATVLVDLTARTDLALQWVPAHGGVKGNKQADRLAKEGGQLKQENSQVGLLCRGEDYH